MPTGGSGSGSNSHRDKNDYYSSTTTKTKDLCKIFDKRFKNFTFTSIPPKLEAWDGSGIVNKVFNEEYNIKHFKSSQEQLTWRIETWIDKCRIQEVDENGLPLNSCSGKFHSAKRFRKIVNNEGGRSGAVNTALTKVRSLSSVSFSLGRAFSKSVENLYKQHDVRLEETSIINASDEFQYATETKASARIAPSKSTNDLLDAFEGNHHHQKPSNDFNHATNISVSGYTNQHRGKHSTVATNNNNNKNFNSNSSPPKTRFNKLLGSVAGKLKPGGSGGSKSSSNNKKKNRNSMDADFCLRQDSIENEHHNNNNNNEANKKSPRKLFRPSVLDFVRSINNKDTHSRHHPTEYEQRPHTIARSTSVAARSTPSPCEYQQQTSQTLFKTRRHNDSLKRSKTKSVGIRPKSAGPFTSSQVFFDPTKSEFCCDPPSVRKDIGDVWMSRFIILLSSVALR